MSTPQPQTALDLQEARTRVSFDSNSLGRVLARSVSASSVSFSPADKELIKAIIASVPEFDKSTKAYMSRAERLARGTKMANRFLQLAEQHKWASGGEQFTYALAQMDEGTGLGLHHVAFTPVIQSQGSDEQQAIWVPKCLSHEILGSYLQTELAHGSNVQRLETTATYDIDTQEFVLKSPTIGSTKWWIGGLGILSTHGVVQAQLITKGKNYGPHLFICQLRSLEDHSLLPGVQIGEIGPKALGGFVATDNGWARFDNVRVPRSQMLARFANVSPGGEYSQPPHAKLSYGSMVYIRAQMIGGLGWDLAKAATIATRYLTTRRQFADASLKRGEANYGIERPVISYPSTYMRIIPQIANAVVFITAGKDMTSLYNSMASKLTTGDTELLAETHAVSSGLKVYVSTTMIEGVETCRRSNGGHGYMESTGIGKIYANAVPSATYEGDNFILNLQVARGALKTLSHLRSDPTIQLAPSSLYLSTLIKPSILPLSSPASAVEWHRSAFQVHLVSLRAALHVQRLERYIQSGKKLDDLSWECVRVCKAIVESFLVLRMWQAVESDDGWLNKEVGVKEKAILVKIVDFFSLNVIVQALPDLLEFGILEQTPPSASPAVILASPLETLRRELDALASSILPDAVGICDSFGFTDFDLDTEIGKSNGRPYENLLERAQRDMDLNAGNSEQRRKMYEENIKPILRRGKASNAAQSKL